MIFGSNILAKLLVCFILMDPFAMAIIRYSTTQDIVYIFILLVTLSIQLLLIRSCLVVGMRICMGK